jgi:hypothetical protein
MYIISTWKCLKFKWLQILNWKNNIKQKPLDFSRGFLVAGTGLEPVTFGL